MKMLPLNENARSSLLIVDMQNFFFRDAERRVNLGEVVQNINRLIACFDACSLPVFHVITSYRADGSNWDLKMKTAGKPELIEASPEAAILPGIHVWITMCRWRRPGTAPFLRQTWRNSCTFCGLIGLWLLEPTRIIASTPRFLMPTLMILSPA